MNKYKNIQSLLSTYKMEETSLSNIRKQKNMEIDKKREAKEAQVLEKAYEIRKLIHSIKKIDGLNMLDTIKSQLPSHNIKFKNCNECDTDIYITSIYLTDSKACIQFFFRADDIIMIVKDKSYSCVVQ